MATKKKTHIKMQCADCKRVNYHTAKSKDAKELKLEYKKFCNWCKKHAVHKEAKKK